MPGTNFLDTSFLLKAYVQESDSDLVTEFVRDRENGLYVSPLTHVEIATALGVSLGPKKALEVYRTYTEDLSSAVFAEVGFSAETWRLASEIGVSHAGSLRLRSLDVLHLSIALQYKMKRIATFDIRLATAAERLALEAFPSGARP